MMNKGWEVAIMDEMGQKYRKRGTNEVLEESPEDFEDFKVGGESTVQKKTPKISFLEHLTQKSC